MIDWKEQGIAAVGQVTLKDGRQGGIVLVAPRNNAKGATIVLPAASGGKPDMVAFMEGMAHLRPADVVQILAMQERLFGSAGLPRPKGLSVGNG